jgi:hypothetical protein
MHCGVDVTESSTNKQHHVPLGRGRGPSAELLLTLGQSCGRVAQRRVVGFGFRGWQVVLFILSRVCHARSWPGQSAPAYTSFNHAAHGRRIHCGVEVTELSTNKQHSLSPRATMAAFTELEQQSPVLLFLCRTREEGPRRVKEGGWGATHRSRNPPRMVGPGVRPGVSPIIFGKSWRCCFVSLAYNAVWGPISRIFTSAYENFLQTAGLQDGDSHCDKIRGVQS